jgi:hypothetical protein
MAPQAAAASTSATKTRYSHQSRNGCFPQKSPMRYLVVYSSGKNINCSRIEGPDLSVLAHAGNRALAPAAVAPSGRAATRPA